MVPFSTPLLRSSVDRTLESWRPAMRVRARVAPIHQNRDGEGPRGVRLGPALLGMLGFVVPILLITRNHPIAREGAKQALLSVRCDCQFLLFIELIPFKHSSQSIAMQYHCMQNSHWMGQLLIQNIFVSFLTADCFVPSTLSPYTVTLRRYIWVQLMSKFITDHYRVHSNFKP